MNAAQLLQHYERIADAPDAVARLRRFVLDLAVRGKLLPQDPSDEPASELLLRILTDKKRLLNARAIRKGNVLTPISGSDQSFKVPRSWIWVRLGDVCQLVTSGSRDWAQHYSSEGAIFVRMGNLSKDHYRLRLEHIQRVNAPDSGEGTRTRLEAGDILISITGDVGMLGLIPEGFGEAYINQHTAMVRPVPEMKGRYLAELFRSPFAQAQFNEPQRGIKNSFRLTDVTQFVVPLPPLAEQRRIVAKVDELMALCDRLETARNEREANRDRLSSATLTRLNTPDGDAKVFAGHARFALGNLHTLTTRLDQIKHLRQTILNLAVRGKLVPQDTKDEPASKLLARHFVQKSKAGIGRNWTAGMSEANDPMFDPPAGWAWTRIADACARVTVGYVGTMKDQYVDAGIPFLRSQNVRANKFREEGMIFISPKFHQTIIKSVLNAGDVVVVRSGNVGTACVIPETITEANCSDLVVVQRPACVVPAFLCFYLNSLAALHISAGAVGVALTHFNTKSVATMPLPLPPLAEQHRIVAKVDQLMALCDGLEASLTDSAATLRHLLDALLADALVTTAAKQREAAE